MPADQRRIVRLALAVLAVGLVLVVWWWAATGPAASAADRPGAGLRDGPASDVAGRPRSPRGHQRPAGGAGGRPPDGGAAHPRPDRGRRALPLLAGRRGLPEPRAAAAAQGRWLLPRVHRADPGRGRPRARRIITGKAGERYWTDDHYASFIVSAIEDGGPVIRVLGPEVVHRRGRARGAARRGRGRRWCRPARPRRRASTCSPRCCTSPTGSVATSTPWPTACTTSPRSRVRTGAVAAPRLGRRRRPAAATPRGLRGHRGRARRGQRRTTPTFVVTVLDR